MTATALPDTLSLSIVHSDRRGGGESWGWVVVFEATGLPDGGLLGEDQVEQILRETQNYMSIASAGSGVPGGRYADEPWIQCYGHTIIVSQSGGMDV